MLRDRSYMRRGPSDDDDGDNYSTGRKAVIGLIIANFLFYLLFPGVTEQSVDLCLSVEGIRHFHLYEIVTAMFLHGGFSHLFSNMFGLLVFGNLCASILGGKQFLKLYFFSGIAGNLMWLFTAWASGSALSVLLGASGAVMGVIMATAMMVPDTEVFLLFIPVPIRLKTLACVYIAIEILQQLSVSSMSHVAYIAHIGGFVGAYLFMMLFQRRYVQWNPLQSLTKNQSTFAGQTRDSKPHGMPRGWSFGGQSDDRKNPNGNSSASSSVRPVSQAELDYLLDKISRDGINSLSEEEMGRLEQARKQMRGMQ